jgi:uncharacterized GH25 family protein
MANKKRLTFITATATLLLFIGITFSHDYWFSLNRFAFTKGDTLVVNLLVGDALNAEVERPLQKEITKSFQLITPAGTIDLLPEIADSTLPVLTYKLNFEGLALVAMERDFWYTKMTDEQFNNSLEHEEMNDIIAMRKKIGRKQEEHKRYDRSIKALLRAGDSIAGEVYKKVLGHKVELILLQNPFMLAPGDDLEVQVIDRGKPLANKLIKAYNGDGEKLVSTQKAYTGENGIAKFKLDRKGFWLIRLSHLWHCADCEKVDWENHYSTFSFMLPE